jgi:nucleotide-binding universal stress UspA family protein
MTVEKLTSILAVIDEPEAGVPIIEKTLTLARRFGADVELLIANDAQVDSIAALGVSIDYDNLTLFSARHDPGALHELIQRRAAVRRADLVIKPPASTHPLRRWALTENDWQLAHECPAPLLLAGPRAWSDPVRFAAAVDVADEEALRFAPGILHTAGFLALGCRGRLDVLYCEREVKDETVRMARAVKLAQLVREFHIGTERLQIFNGSPDERLVRLIGERDYDVLALGATSHRSSLSGKLVDAGDGDVVLVPENLRKPATRRLPSSAGEQRLDESEQLI